MAPTQAARFFPSRKDAATLRSKPLSAPSPHAHAATCAPPRHGGRLSLRERQGGGVHRISEVRQPGATSAAVIR